MERIVAGALLRDARRRAWLSQTVDVDLAPADSLKPRVRGDAEQEAIPL